MAFFLPQKELERVYDPEEMHQVVKDFAKLFDETPNLDSLPTNSLQYSEFEPKAFFAILRKYNSNENKLNEDMSFLVPLILSYGTDMLQAFLPFSPETQEKLQEIVTKYHIEKILPLQSTNETITLRRILRAFPEIAFRVLKDNPDLPRLLSPKKFEKKWGYKNFPACLAGDFIFSLIPPESEGKNYDGVVKAALHYQFEEIHLMNYNHSKPSFDEEEMMKEILLYGYKLCLESRFSSKEKKNFMDELNIDETDTKEWAKQFDRCFFCFKNVGLYFGQKPAGFSAGFF